MNSKIFDIDFNMLGRWLLPLRLRRPLLLAFVFALALPFVYIYQAFKNYRNQKLYELEISPQVCFLRKLLNDRYDTVDRRIYIENGDKKVSPFIYKRAENKPVFLFNRTEAMPEFIYTGTETELYENFIVFVPAVLALDILEVAGLVRNVVLPGMKFKIELI